MENAICDQCTVATAFYCSRCRCYTCEHYSLWADDDPRGPNGEQLVHRCNWCQGELEALSSDAEATKLLEDFRIEIQQATLGTAELHGADGGDA